MNDTPKNTNPPATSLKSKETEKTLKKAEGILKEAEETLNAAEEILKEKNETPKKYLAIGSGILVIAAWVALFTTGLDINSDYYRAAVAYSFATWQDWVMTIASFTLTNVVILAFLSGFLGGICSKIIITEGFHKSRAALKREKTDYVLYENPFISAFRGVFIFLALLAFQYVSSFSDLSSIGKDSQTQTSQPGINKMYYTLLDSVNDSASRQKIKILWQKESNTLMPVNNDSIVDSICRYQNYILNNKDDRSISMWQEKIRKLRTKVQLPALADIPGLSASGYFRFAVIVSLLAFICGYDPKRFNSLLSAFPLLSKAQEDKQSEDKVREGKVEEEKEKLKGKDTPDTPTA